MVLQQKFRLFGETYIVVPEKGNIIMFSDALDFLKTVLTENLIVVSMAEDENSTHLYSSDPIVETPDVKATMPSP